MQILSPVLLLLVVVAGLAPARAQTLPASGLDARPDNAACVAPARLAGSGSLGAGWTGADIGAVDAAGSTTIPGAGRLTLRGSGSDIWGSRDEFHFAYRALTGDGDLVARVTGLTNTNAWAKAGVMVRASLAADSPFGLMLMTPGGNGGAFQYRTSPGGSAAPSNSADRVSTLPRWLRVSRRGGVVTGFVSADGQAWVERGRVTLPLRATVYVGLATTSHADGTLATASFDNVTASLANAVAPEAPTATVVDAFPGAPAFVQPTKLVESPGDPGRWFVLEKTGRIRAFRGTAPGTVTTWLDFSARVNTASEGGLLGLAFHPAYPSVRQVFVTYTAGSPMQLVLARLTLDQVTAPVTVAEQVLLRIDKAYNNHNGGDLAFGPDGYLYVSVGDGGGSGDPGNHAQNPARLLGKVLRLDVTSASGAAAYGIPADNPWAGNARCGAGANAAACPEIFALGLRNPWRFAFDAATGALWAADVGQNAREEINVIVRGGNYGWRCREGAAAYNTSGCPTAGFAAPVHDYPHGDGNGSVTGGFVYRGTALPGLAGRYLFADYLSGRIWALRETAAGYVADELADTPLGIVALVPSLTGEPYVVDHAGGRLYRLATGGTPQTDPVPDDLAATGCMAAANPQQPAPGLIGYSVNAPFWSDGADKERYLALPDGTWMTADATGRIAFPSGAVLVKTMRLAGQPVETRLLMNHPDTGWAGYTYEWSADGTRATRVRGGKTRFIAGQDWIYPSEGQCFQCHTAAAGIVLGPEVAQLNRPHYYPATGRTANQLDTLARVGMLAGVAPATTLMPLPDPAVAYHTLEQRARAYLHANCANCHRPAGPTPSAMDLRYQAPLAIGTTRTCNVMPQSGDLGIANARLVAPGDPARSILLQRVTRRDAHGMPPLGSSLADAAGAALLRDWIIATPACETQSCH
jgi:uncharacterized repeat protein (TIGR03806 family)